MSGEIRKVAVIGSGVMGSGIAAQIANAGFPVLLLDIVGADAADRGTVAKAALARVSKSDALMSPKSAALITPGNIEDDLGAVAECDWIVEVVLERLDVKQALFRKLDAVRRPGTPVSSNTSTIPLAALVAGMPDAFARDFLVTHFFNPPRYMRLLEVVTGPKTDPGTARRISAFADVGLGKSIVKCNDSPGFIANRLGVYWMQRGVIDAMDLGLGVEQADAVMGKPFGIPKTGVFGLLDLVGIDLMPHVNHSLGELLPKSDPFHATLRDMPLVTRMIADGLTGRKGKGGFYRMSKTPDGARSMEAIGLDSGAYAPAGTADLSALKGAERDLRGLMAADTPFGRYAWQVMGRTLAYATALVPEAVGDITGVDEAMRLGYNWKQGPFELIDRIGAGWLAERLREDGVAVPPLLQKLGARTFYRVEGGRRQFFGLDGAYHDVVRAPGVLLLEDVKLAAEPVLRNASAALWDIGDGVACFEFTSKMNAIDQPLLDLLAETARLVPERFKALVLYNEGTNFSAGANLGVMLAAAAAGRWAEIEALIAAGQHAFEALKYAPFPVVSAPAGLALGGGCEAVLCADAVQAHAETYAGLVECGVGLIPGWRGCAEMLQRQSAAGADPAQASSAAFELIFKATAGRSAAQARDAGILREGDGITMNRTRLLADAKAKALALVPGYHPPHKAPICVAGPSVRAALDRKMATAREAGAASEHDVAVAAGLAEVLTGGEGAVGEDDILALEREIFMRLVRTTATQARIDHILKTGKPLRN